MNKHDQKQWIEKTQRLNENIELEIGMEVQDLDGNKGIVVKINEWVGELSEENHGSIAVWQSERINYGSDNCEHYSLYNWKNILRILTDNIYTIKPNKKICK